MLEWAPAFAAAFFLLFVIQTFFYAPFIVKGDSMMPTLNHQSRMIVDKASYIFKAPKRFDIIVFQANENENYIKRIIGLPGDTIEYQNDTLYVNGKPYEEPYLDVYKLELMQNERLTDDFKMEELTGEAVVPEGELFVLGDNRPQSNDSRTIGTIPMVAVIGKASVVYWSLQELRIEKYRAPSSETDL